MPPVRANLYKCRHIRKKNAEHSTLNVALQASGLSPMWKKDDNLTMYEMHYCADGSLGISDFIGSKKVNENGN